MVRSLILAALALGATEARAQFTMTPVAQDSSFRTLTVTGTGEAKANSDRAVLRIAFETEGKTIDEALERHQEEVDRVQALLRDGGIPDDQIFVDRASVGESEGEYGGPADEEGFTASRFVTVYVDDLDRVPRLMAEVVKNSGDDLLTVQRRNVDVSYVLQDRAALRSVALRKAVTDARDRAGLIAEMAGLQLGRVVTVNEQGVQAALFGPVSSNDQAAMMQMMGGGGGGEHRVQSGVVVTFVLQ